MSDTVYLPHNELLYAKVAVPIFEIEQLNEAPEAIKKQIEGLFRNIERRSNTLGVKVDWATLRLEVGQEEVSTHEGSAPMFTFLAEVNGKRSRRTPKLF